MLFILRKKNKQTKNKKCKITQTVISGICL
jgi:hypothetical protein